MTALNKPTVGATGWGSDVNTNFDLIMETFATIAGGRLTASSSDPVPTTDQTGSTLYYLPYKSSKIGLYDTTASAWCIEDIGSSGVSIGVSGLSADTNYDAFLYDSSGTLTIELVAWSNNTTRATAISRKDGVWVKGTGGGQAPERRYLGTVRTISGISFTDAEQKRFVWNVDNRLPRHGANRDGTANWTLNSPLSTWQGLNAGDADWKFEFVQGLEELAVEAYLSIDIRHVTENQLAYIGMGLDSTTPTTTNNPIAYGYVGTGASHRILTLQARHYAGLGYHYLQGLELTHTAGAIFYGGSTASIMTMTIVG